MQDYISISMLNDFIFCPYSIYLHNVYMNSDEDLIHATPQTKGKAAHFSIDNKTYSSHKNQITALSVYSEEFGIMGQIDLYKQDEELLVERKYHLPKIYQGQIYQLWAQYFCMIEMGYSIKKLAFYAISNNITFPVKIPEPQDKEELKAFIHRFKTFDPSQPLKINVNKCTHCIYCNLCDKTQHENVYN